MNRIDRAFEEMKRAVDAGEMDIGLDLEPLSLPPSRYQSHYDGLIPTLLIIGGVVSAFWFGLYQGFIALGVSMLFFRFVVRRIVFRQVRRRVLADVLKTSFQWDSFWREGHASLRRGEKDDVFSPGGDWAEFVFRDKDELASGKPPADHVVVTCQPTPDDGVYLQKVVSDTAAAVRQAETGDLFDDETEEDEALGEPLNLDLEGFAIRVLAPPSIDRRQVIGKDFHETYKQEIFLLLDSLRDLGLLGSETREHPNPPENCDLCGLELALGRWFIDGATKDGAWANMCPACFYRYGRGIKFGLGQAYLKLDNGAWRMVAGGEVPRS